MILVNIFNACSLIFLLCLSQILISHLSMGLWIRALGPGRPAAVLSIHSPRRTCPTTCHPTCSRPTNPSSHKVRRKRQAGDSSVSKLVFVKLCFLWLVCHSFEVLWKIGHRCSLYILIHYISLQIWILQALLCFSCRSGGGESTLSAYSTQSARQYELHSTEEMKWHFTF